MGTQNITDSSEFLWETSPVSKHSTSVASDDYEDIDGELDDIDDDLTSQDEADIEAFEAEEAAADLEVEAAFQADLAEMDAEINRDPFAPVQAIGEPLWVGFDAEWVFDKSTQTNTILTIQLYVPKQPGVTYKKDKRDKYLPQLSRLIEADAPTQAGRPCLLPNLRRLVDDALTWELIAEAPRFIYVVSFGLRFDLAALGDFYAIKNEIDSVSGKAATVKKSANLMYEQTLVTGDMGDATQIGLRFVDVAAHVAPGTALWEVGEQLGLKKLKIPKPYSIEAMDVYLREDPEGFKQYAMRDAEIAVKYALGLAEFADRYVGLKQLPATASGLALKWCLKKFKQHAIDRLPAFGLHVTKKEAWNTPLRLKKVIRVEEPTPMRRMQEPFLTDCYAGGRNESYWLGPSPVDHWYDYDLAGAYSTGLLDLPLIDFENPRPSLNTEDFLEHVAGYALVDFKHPEATRFPVFAISRGGRGLIFPLEGMAYATAPEIRTAHDLGCEIKIRWGVLYDWVRKGDDPEGAVPQFRPFEPFVKEARDLRRRLKKEAGGVDTLESLAAKLYANGLYGKICQSLREKMVYDTRFARSVRLQPSAVTNPAIAAHVTGFIRAILAEILNKIPQHRVVLSCTTDGFITNAREDEIDLSGPLCQRFNILTRRLDPKGKMLEIKHQVAQVICMKTRGQLTGQPFVSRGKNEIGELVSKTEAIILAKAGVQLPIKIDPEVELTKEEYKAAQNEKMLNLYLNRRGNKKIVVSQFPSLRDQWEKGIDLYKYERFVALSLEPDLKRQLVDPHMLMVASRGIDHIAMSSRPWKTVEEFDQARNCLDAWRKNNCLKTLEDWDSFCQVLEGKKVRAGRKAAGELTINRRGTKPESDVLRRMFLRAYAQEALGLKRKKGFTYEALAIWLTTEGFATKPSEPRSAKAQPLVLNSAGRTSDSMKLFRLLQANFPGADLEQLLVPAPSQILQL
ncbi:hypothetical protein [Propionivibrio sp.]|uniref:hypothetical protein n=1 Tax=Propionivibrio sp. TaxID=2212460 RepID=UPI003BF44009